MASVFASIRPRMVAILTEGRGITGDFSAHCKDIVAIPSGVFRFPKKYAPLTDPQLKSVELDRAISITWRTQNNMDGAWNEFNGRGQKRYKMEISHAVVFGENAANNIKNYGGEVQANCIDYETANERLFSDQVWIERAVTLPELHGNDTDPKISAIVQGDDSSLIELPDRLILVTPYLVALDFSHSTAYRP